MIPKEHAPIRSTTCSEQCYGAETKLLRLLDAHHNRPDADTLILELFSHIDRVNRQDEIQLTTTVNDKVFRRVFEQAIFYLQIETIRLACPARHRDIASVRRPSEARKENQIIEDIKLAVIDGRTNFQRNTCLVKEFLRNLIAIIHAPSYHPVLPVGILSPQTLAHNATVLLRKAQNLTVSPMRQHITRTSPSSGRRTGGG